MLRSIVYKILSALVRLRHGSIDPSLRYFYRDTYLCQLKQLKYFLNDYVFRQPYKIIYFDGEFAPDLQFVLPFAYWHYKNGTLKATRGAKFTSELYFFSPDHREVFETRTNEGNYNYEAPRVLYSHNYNMKKWLPVPLKEVYKNNIYVFEKPILVVANRFNKEWDRPPISYFSIEMLDHIFNLLKEDYTIIYNRPGVGQIAMDNSEIYELNEWDWMRQTHPEVILMEDLYRENKGVANNFNHLQLMVYANAENFVSIHGGTSVLASYFGGTNIILSKEGPEHSFGCFHKLYPKFSGARIYHAKTDEALKQHLLLLKRTKQQHPAF